ncbi:hypothetical protein F5Y16DRAFT_62731 [Xylariaceae sp. FL0255]|nr:hypothetical protein F5Y16DRAFT_62731 [Xylariaceae sp. FL0255]
MNNNLRPKCDVCYNLDDRSTSAVTFGCDGPNGNDQFFERGDDGSALGYLNGELVKSKSATCIFCAFITDVAESSYFLLRLDQRRTPVIDVDSAKRRRRVEIYRLIDVALVPNPLRKEIKFSKLFPVNHISKRPKVSEEVFSSQATTFIRSCLEKCTHDHPHYRVDPAQPPKRLIEIEGPGGPRVKVIETSVTFCKAICGPELLLGTRSQSQDHYS